MFICFSRGLSKSCSLLILSVYNCITGLARNPLNVTAYRPSAGIFWLGRLWLTPGSAPGNPPGLSSKHSQHCPSTDTGVSCLVGPPGHFSFSWSILAFVPGAFPPLVLSILQPQVLRCPLCPCIPSSCLTSPSFLLAPSAHLSANPSCFSQPQSSFFSLVCSSFPAFELSSFSVLPGHNAENERKEKII